MREVLVAVKRFVIRFFDDLCARTTSLEDEIEHLRTQIQIKDHQIQLLIEKLNSQPMQPAIENRADDKVLPKPIIPENLPWPQRKAILEREDRDRFRQYQKERDTENPSKTKTTEELEQELLIK